MTRRARLDLLLTTVLLAACGGSTSTSNPTPTPAPKPGDAESPAPTTPGHGPAVT